MPACLGPSLLVSRIQYLGIHKPSRPMPFFPRFLDGRGSDANNHRRGGWFTAHPSRKRSRRGRSCAESCGTVSERCDFADLAMCSDEERASTSEQLAPLEHGLAPLDKRAHSFCRILAAHDGQQIGKHLAYSGVVVEVCKGAR